MKKVYFTLLLSLMTGDLMGSEIRLTGNLIPIKKIHFKNAIEQTYEGEDGKAHPMARLPNDLKVYIFEMAERRDVLSILSTCTEWYELGISRRKTPNSIFNPLTSLLCKLIPCSMEINSKEETQLGLSNLMLSISWGSSGEREESEGHPDTELADQAPRRQRPPGRRGCVVF